MTTPILSLDHPAAQAARTESDDPTFDAVWATSSPDQTDRMYDVLVFWRDVWGYELTPAVGQALLWAFAQDADECFTTEQVAYLAAEHLNTNQQESAMTQTKYDNGLPDVDATLEEQIIDAGGVENLKVISKMITPDIPADSTPWLDVDALLDRFDTLAPDLDQADHDEWIARASRKYFGQRNPAYITMIPLGASRKADWDGDGVVFVYARPEDTRALLTVPTGEIRTWDRPDGSEGSAAVRRVVKYATWSDRDECDEWVKDLRSALRDAQIDPLADLAADPASTRDPLADLV